MKIYMARQPIYNSKNILIGYELLYRDSDNNCYSNVNGDKATRALTYNVLLEFDFDTVTNFKYGFINFTKESLMSDIPLLFNKDNIIIEILENITIDNNLIEKIIELKNKNYILALDDFIDDGRYEEILPYIDIIKVEYGILDEQKRRYIANKYKGNKKLIAERIETKEDFKNAIEDGYELFQGYYFSKPIMISKNKINIASSTYIRLWNEINKEKVDLDSLEEVIKLDASVTYKLFSLMNTPEYYRGTEVNSVKQALVRLGVNNIKRWIIIFFLDDLSTDNNDEFAKLSLIRALFMENISIALGKKEISQDSYFVGLLSMIENILEEDIISIFNTLHLSDNVKDALINKNNFIYEILECIKEYEITNWNKVEDFSKKYKIDGDKISSIYLECLEYADKIFIEK